MLQSLDKNGFLDLLEGKSPASSQPLSKRPKMEVKKEEDEDEDDGRDTWNALRYRNLLSCRNRWFFLLWSG